MAKERLDILLVEKDFFDSREKAKRAIMAGLIFVDNQRVDKPGSTVDTESVVEVRGKTLQYVSRGGLKLEKAIDHFNVNLQGMVCMDIGASTGGFSDCMLQNGAVKVFSVDVGYGQLDWKLRNDPKIVNMERTNIRYVTLEDLGEPLDFVSIDVSFISLKLVLPVAVSLMKPNSQIVFLIKPQFEAGRENVKKNGVVRDAKVHIQVIEDVLKYAEDANIQITALSFSPITGPKGNIEFLAVGQVNSGETIETFDKGLIKDVVTQAHESLKN
ncbi:MAG: TlyA family RNA methyltransferase [Clostridia bacterium]|nr:TlyA family RNA methyltransferase [Clostridia bacterium]